jgi:hypothetical protein
MPSRSDKTNPTAHLRGKKEGGHAVTRKTPTMNVQARKEQGRRRQLERALARWRNASITPGRTEITMIAMMTREKFRWTTGMLPK